MLGWMAPVRLGSRRPCPGATDTGEAGSDAGRPEGTRVGAAPEPSGVRIITETIQAVLDHLRAEGRNEVHVQNVKRYLADWGDILQGRPLQTVSSAELERHLDAWPFRERAKSRRYKLVALKCFASFYMHQKHLLRAHQNPAAGLVVKRPKPKDPEIYSIEQVEERYRYVELQCMRDVLVLRAKGKLHGSEIDRMARGEGNVEPVTDHLIIVGVLSYPHKRGETHRQFIDAQMAEAVKRLQERGSAPTIEVPHPRLGLRTPTTLLQIACWSDSFFDSLLQWSFEGSSSRPRST